MRVVRDDVFRETHQSFRSKDKISRVVFSFHFGLRDHVLTSGTTQTTVFAETISS